MEKINYTAVILDERSRNKIFKIFDGLMPDDWEIIGHHLTIKMGSYPEDWDMNYMGQSVDLGSKVRLAVSSFGYTDLVCAVEVPDFPSKNKYPHITLAVNRKKGGKPVMSNEITNWQTFKKPFYINGVVKEIPYRIPEQDVK